MKSRDSFPDFNEIAVLSLHGVLLPFFNPIEQLPHKKGHIIRWFITAPQSARVIKKKRKILKIVDMVVEVSIAWNLVEK